MLRLAVVGAVLSSSGSVIACINRARSPQFKPQLACSLPPSGLIIVTSTATSGRAKVLSAAATFAEEHALRLAPFPFDARKEFPSLFVTPLEKIEAVIGATVVGARVAAIGGDLVVLEPTSTASDDTR